MTHGGRQPECWWQPFLATCDGWRFCAKSEQEAKHGFFAPTIKSVSPFALGCLSPSGLHPCLNLLAFSLLSSIPVRPSHWAALFPSWAVLVSGKEKGEPMQGGSEGSVQWFYRGSVMSTLWTPTSSHSRAPSGWAEPKHISSIHPSSPDSQIPVTTEVYFWSSTEGFLVLNSVSLAYLLRHCPTQLFETWSGVISTVHNFSSACEPSDLVCCFTRVIYFSTSFFLFFFFNSSPPPTQMHRPHRDFHAFKWKSWTVPFSCSHYAALPFSVLILFQSYHANKPNLKKKIKNHYRGFHPINFLPWLLLTVRVKRNPFSWLPFSFRYIDVFLISNSLFLWLPKMLWSVLVAQ